MKPPVTHTRSALCIAFYVFTAIYFVAAGVMFQATHSNEMPWQAQVFWLTPMLAGGIILFLLAAIFDVVGRMGRRADEMAWMIFEANGGEMPVDAAAEAAPAGEQSAAAAAAAVDPGDEKYFYMVKEEIYGPFRFRELLTLRSTGEINDATLVQKEDEDNWVELGSLPQMAPAAVE